MVRRFIFVLAALAALTLGAPSARADFAVGAGISTLGVGGHGAVEINDFLVLRLNANFGSFDLGVDTAGIDYDAETDLLTAGLLVDVHPFGISPIGDGFVITAGAYYNANEMTFTASPTGTVSIGDNTYNIAAIQTDIEFSEFAPFLSLGYDGTFHTLAIPVAFFIKAGVLFQGAPDVTVRTVGGGVSKSDLNKEARQIEDDLAAFEYYPVLSLGITISF
jgi:hypothetical protein